MGLLQQLPELAREVRLASQRGADKHVRGDTESGARVCPVLRQRGRAVQPLIRRPPEPAGRVEVPFA
jgi:hypothetical protein